jgi:hypothetical protein
MLRLMKLLREVPVMKWLKIGLVVLVVLVAGAGAVLASGAVGLRDGSVLKQSETVTSVEGPQYLDENMVVKVARAEGKYGVGVAVINPDVEAVLVQGDLKAYLTASDKPMTLKWTFDELTPERMDDLHIYVYAKGWRPVKQPLLTLGFGAVKDALKYETLAEFKEYIQPPTE